MTVKVRQPAINIREKLKELEATPSTRSSAVVFRGNLPANQNFPNITYTKYDMSDVKTDTHNGFDPATGEYIIPENGHYIITFMQWWNNKPEGRTVLRVYVNGVAVTSDYTQSRTGSSVTTQAVLTLNRNDSVSMYVYQDSGTVQLMDASDLNNGVAIVKIGD